MILFARSGTLRLVLQTEHARIAAEFARHWGGALFAPPVPLGPVALAAEQHDFGWAEWEKAPSVRPETGRPYDFLHLPVPVHLQVYERAIRHVVELDPYAGLLVSLHGTGLYRKRFGHMDHLVFREHDPKHWEAIAHFLQAQEALQARLRAALDVDESALWTHYRWLQAWDLLSLFLALSDPAEAPEMLLGTMPYRPGGPEVALVARGVGPGRFSVDPWPFDAKAIAVTLSARYVQDRIYTDEADFRQSFSAAPCQGLRLLLTPPGR